MSKICPICNKEWPDDFMACPIDGTGLISKPQQSEGFRLNLGDANAISGGVNMSDNHSVSNNTVNNTTSNVDSHNIITNNITNNTSTVNNINLHRTESEVLHDREIEFIKIVRDAFVNGILDHDSANMLERERIHIGLDEERAKRIIESIRNEFLSSQQATLSPAQTFIVKQVIQYIKANQTENISRQIPRLEAIVKNTRNEEVQYLYYLSLAAVSPFKIIKEFESHSADNYWQTFWAYIAYTKQCMFKKAEDALFKLSCYSQYPEENIILLSAVGAMRDFGSESALEFISSVKGEYSTFLEDYVIAIFYLIEPESISIDETNKSFIEFYLKNLLQFEDIEEQSKLYNLRLLNVGTNTFKLAMILKSNLEISLNEAKVLMECCPIDIIKKQTKNQLEPKLRLIEETGATAEIVDL